MVTLSLTYYQGMTDQWCLNDHSTVQYNRSHDDHMISLQYSAFQVAYPLIKISDKNIINQIYCVQFEAI